MNLLRVESNADIENYLNDIRQTFYPIDNSTYKSRRVTLIDIILFNEFCSNIGSGKLTEGTADHNICLSFLHTKFKIYNPKKLYK